MADRRQERAKGANVKLLSGLVTAATVAASGFGCGALALAYVVPEPAPYTPPQPAAVSAPAESAARALPTRWPDLFGVLPPAPAPDPEPAPEPVAEEPPEQNQTYFLTGLISGRNGASWAMISENDRGVVVRVGDTLVGGEKVTAIDPRGVWIEYQGETQLIPVQEQDLASLVWTETATTPSASPAEPLAEISIVVEDLSLDFVRRLLEQAGDVAATVLEDGTPALAVTALRQGELFDRIGLRAGDRIVAVNGRRASGAGLLANAPDGEITPGGSLDFDILRDGALMKVKVNLDQG